MKSSYFATATSSLDLAMEMAANGQLAVWDSVLVGQQSAGRGQMRRQWFSPPGNLHVALRLPILPPLDSTAAAPVMAVLLAESLESALPEILPEAIQGSKAGGPCPKAPEILVKWPNDIVIDNKGTPAKLAGILLEQKGDVLLAGIGLNLVQAPPGQSLRQDHAMPATCLAEVLAGNNGQTGAEARPGWRMPDPRDLWPELAGRIRALFTPGFCAAWQARLEARLLWLGRDVEVTDGQSRCRGRLHGIDPEGGLLIVTCGGPGAEAGKGCQVLFSGSLALLA